VAESVRKVAESVRKVAESVRKAAESGHLPYPFSRREIQTMLKI
jgi:hypothetical protein